MREHAKFLQAFAASIALLLCTAFLLGGCGSSGYLDGLLIPPPPVELQVSLHPYDEQEMSPLEITARVHAYDDDLSSCEIDWGDGAGWEQVTTRDPTHQYLHDGCYTIRVRQIMGTGEYLTASIEIRIGPEIRDYYDPQSDQIVQIYDGRAMVGFFDWQRFGGFEGPIAEDPYVAAFLEEENLRVYTEWKSIGVILVILPEGTTVDEAIAEWPARYPELIEVVEPDVVADIPDES